MMIIVIIMCTLIILMGMFGKRKRIYIKNDKGFIERGVLSEKECKKLINIANTYTYETKPDGIDQRPEYQIDIIARGLDNPELWEISKDIYLNRLKPILKTLSWMPDDKLLRYVFLRKYHQSGRTHVPLHLDDNYLTMSFLLSEPSEFDGGDLYIFDLKKSNAVDALGEITLEEDEEYIRNYKKLPIVDNRRGDLAVYTGGINYHGTLPITRGERYILTFFFS